jgi:hypothetical protein
MHTSRRPTSINSRKQCSQQWDSACLTPNYQLDSVNRVFGCSSSAKFSGLTMRPSSRERPDNRVEGLPVAFGPVSDTAQKSLKEPRQLKTASSGTVLGHSSPERSVA